MEADHSLKSPIPLVNAHTHLELSALGSLLPQEPAALAPWVSRVAVALRRSEPGALQAACELGVDALVVSGATHVGDVSWSGASVMPLARSGLRGIVWLEMRGVLLRDGLERLSWLRKEVDRLRRIAANSPIRIGAELHAPYTIHPALWEPVLRWIESEQLPLCIHAAESTAEWDLFLRGTGDLRHYDAMMPLSGLPWWLRLPLAAVATHAKGVCTRLGYPYPLSLGLTPVAYLKRVGALEFRPLLVHLVHVADEDIEYIRRSGSVAVHCPRSNQNLRCGRMPLEQFLGAGIPRGPRDRLSRLGGHPGYP